MVLLHSLAVALRFYYMPLFEAAAVVCSRPGFARLDGMPAGDVVRLASSYAAVGHYDATLLRRMVSRYGAVTSYYASYFECSTPIAYDILY